MGGNDEAVEAEVAGPGAPLSGAGGAGVTERTSQPSSLWLTVGMWPHGHWRGGDRGN